MLLTVWSSHYCYLLITISVRLYNCFWDVVESDCSLGYSQTVSRLVTFNSRCSLQISLNVCFFFFSLSNSEEIHITILNKETNVRYLSVMWDCLEFIDIYSFFSVVNGCNSSSGGREACLASSKIVISDILDLHRVQVDLNSLCEIGPATEL